MLEFVKPFALPKPVWDDSDRPPIKSETEKQEDKTKFKGAFQYV
jgi:hypothetical protein